jgi:hypothetical protein
MGTKSIGVYLFVEIEQLSFATKGDGDRGKIFKLEYLPLMVRGRINMLRLAKDYTYLEGLGYKGRARSEDDLSDDLSRESYSLKTLELTVLVEEDELKQIYELCPTIIVYRFKDKDNEKAD